MLKADRGPVSGFVVLRDSIFRINLKKNFRLLCKPFSMFCWTISPQQCEKQCEKQCVLIQHIFEVKKRRTESHLDIPVAEHILYLYLYFHQYKNNLHCNNTHIGTSLVHICNLETFRNRRYILVHRIWTYTFLYFGLFHKVWSLQNKQTATPI